MNGGNDIDQSKMSDSKTASKGKMLLTAIEPLPKAIAKSTGVS